MPSGDDPRHPASASPVCGAGSLYLTTLGRDHRAPSQPGASSDVGIACVRCGFFIHYDARTRSSDAIAATARHPASASPVCGAGFLYITTLGRDHRQAPSQPGTLQYRTCICTIVVCAKNCNAKNHRTFELIAVQDQDSSSALLKTIFTHSSLPCSLLSWTCFRRYVGSSSVSGSSSCSLYPLSSSLSSSRPLPAGRSFCHHAHSAFA
jgi:hypothetical protein